MGCFSGDLLFRYGSMMSSPIILHQEFNAKNWPYWRQFIFLSMSQILSSNRLKESKAPRWRIWVPDLKDSWPWVKIWNRHQKIKVWNHGQSLTFGLEALHKISQRKERKEEKKYNNMKKKNYAIAKKISYKHNLQTCIFINFST